MNVIRDGSNKVIAIIRPYGSGEGVYTPEGRFLGYTDNRGTFDSNSNRIATSSSPGLLVR